MTEPTSTGKKQEKLIHINCVLLNQFPECLIFPYVFQVLLKLIIYYYIAFASLGLCCCIWAFPGAALGAHRGGFCSRAWAPERGLSGGVWA